MRTVGTGCALLLLIGCGEDASEGPTCRDALAGVVSPPAPGWDTGRERRDLCDFDTGSLVTESVGPTALNMQQIPLKHVIVMMMENRSFDHYFAELKDDGVDADGVHDRSNPDPSQHGMPIAQYPEEIICEPKIPNGPDHEWGPTHLQFDNGRMDGFVAASNPQGSRAMGYYRKKDIPFFYWLARNFAISDRHFSSLLGPTWPNRLFMVAATSCGYAEGYDSNYQIGLDCGATHDNIFDRLDDAGVSFKVFTAGAVPLVSSLFFDIFALDDPTKFANVDTFHALAASNSLPAVSVIEPNYESETSKVGGAPNDDHPPANIQRGQVLISEVVKSLMSNPDTWKTSALFITYDEHGGYYDHVVPPRACRPEGGTGPVADYAFDRLGVRVPLIVVSAYAKSHYVSHHVTDHTSIIRFIEGWQNLGALTRRDANAWPMLDIFEFDRTPFDPPTPTAADMPIYDPAADADCPEH